MRYGFVLPYGDARTATELAVLAEEHGWDGFFVWEPVWGIDAWVSLTAAAMRTDRIRLGTMLTPLPRRKPWDVASQSATLDNLAGGRVILSVGLGAPDDRWWLFEEDPGRRTRAELLDEGLELVTGLWRGEPLCTRANTSEHDRPNGCFQRLRSSVRGSRSGLSARGRISSRCGAPPVTTAGCRLSCQSRARTRR